MFVFGSKILANMRQRRRASHFCKAAYRSSLYPARFERAGDGYTGLHKSVPGRATWGVQVVQVASRHGVGYGPGRVHGGVLYMQWLWNFISK